MKKQGKQQTLSMPLPLQQQILQFKRRELVSVSSCCIMLTGNWCYC